MHDWAFWLGFYSQPVLLLGLAYFSIRFMVGLYRKVTRP